MILSITREGEMYRLTLNHHLISNAYTADKIKNICWELSYYGDYALNFFDLNRNKISTPKILRLSEITLSYELELFLLKGLWEAGYTHNFPHPKCLNQQQVDIIAPNLLEGL